MFKSFNIPFIAFLVSVGLCLTLAGCSAKPRPSVDVPATTQGPKDGFLVDRDKSVRDEPGKADKEEIKEEKEEEEEIVYTDEAVEEDGVYVYDSVLNELFGVYFNGYDHSVEYEYFPIGMLDRITYDESTFLDEVGFELTDISGDGIAELLIGEDMGLDDQYTLIYACYTRKDGEIVRTFEGGARSSHIWMGDGHFSYQGSDSAWSSLFGEAHISRDGTELVWDDLYFSDMASDDPDDGIVYFHNKSGFYDKNAPDNEEITQEEFVDLMDVYMAKGTNLTMYPLKNLDTSAYKTDQVATDTGSTVPLSDSLQKELNVFVSNFVEAGLLFYDQYNDPDVIRLAWFAFDWTKINRNSDIDVVDDHYHITVDKFNSVLKRYLGITLTEEQIKDGLASYEDFYIKGNGLYCPLAEGEAYDDLAIVEKMVDNRDGTWTLYFDTYDLDLDLYLENVKMDKYYKMSTSEASASPDLSADYHGTALVKKDGDRYILLSIKVE